MLVRDAMTPDPVTVGTTRTVEEIAAVLATHRISAVPVVDEHRGVLGVVSEADLLQDAFPPDRRSHLRPPPEPRDTSGRTAGEVMTSPALTVHAATDVAEVVVQMRSHGFKSLPVVDDAGTLVGIISRSDLVRVRARGDEAIRDDVLSLFGDLLHPDWQVDVVAGSVVVTGPTTSEDRAVAEASAASVAGVVRVTTRAP